MAPPTDNSHRTSPGSPEPGPLSDKRIAVALSGGIACYKTATLVSRLVQRGADVRVLMTESATRFVGPITFQSLSGKPVLTSIWQADDHPDSQHIGVARWCDLMVIAPATANIIAKLAHGLTDDPVSLIACALPSGTPLLLAPAMNADMWDSVIVQKNVATLNELSHVTMVGPESGWQACRTEGAGRMSEAEAIIGSLEGVLQVSENNG
jgi:phosphopantothenoylcysteine synthetase/decarboxylase